jgi:hypothetical protein
MVSWYVINNILRNYYGRRFCCFVSVVAIALVKHNRRNTILSSFHGFSIFDRQIDGPREATGRPSKLPQTSTEASSGPSKPPQTSAASSSRPSKPPQKFAEDKRMQKLDSGRSSVAWEN